MSDNTPLGFTIRIDGRIDFEYFLPTEDGVRLAAGHAGYSEEDYEVVALGELQRAG